MATFETTRPAPFGAETTYHVVSIIENVYSKLVELNAKRQTRATLNGLSDALLTDIGLIRGDLDGSTKRSKHLF